MGEMDASGGYDCMTAACKIGPCVIDGAFYGQKSCVGMSLDLLTKMDADARFIAAAKKMSEALEKTLANNAALANVLNKAIDRFTDTDNDMVPPNHELQTWLFQARVCLRHLTENEVIKEALTSAGYEF